MFKIEHLKLLVMLCGLLFESISSNQLQNLNEIFIYTPK